MQIIRGINIEIKPGVVLKKIGYILADQKKPPEIIRESLEEDRKEIINLLQKYKSKVRPQAIRNDFWCEIKDQEITLYQSGQERAKFSSSFLSSHLQEGGVSLFIVTIGKEIEQIAKEYKKAGDDLRATILDAIGSEGAERTAIYIHRLIEKEKRIKLVRYSPGYGEIQGQDWSIKDQKIIFNLLHPEKIGVHLLESCMMFPEKSVSAIIGLGKKRIKKIKKPAKNSGFSIGSFIL